MSEYVRLPVEAFPDPVSRFISENADTMKIDPAFIALPVIATLAGATGTTRQIALKDAWAEPAVVWSCLISRSGTLKSPAYDAAIQPLVEAEHRAQAANDIVRTEYQATQLHHEKKLAAWKRGNEGGDPPAKPEFPALRRYILSDLTLESLAPILRDNPRGVLVAREELAALFRSFNQYRGGKGADAAAWLELHKGGRISVDRKNDRGPIYVPRAAVSITGTIQPELFANVMRGELLQSGHAARLLVAQPPTMCKTYTDRSPSRLAVDGYAALVESLLTLEHERGDYGPRPFTLRLTPDALTLWRAWFAKHARRQHEAPDDAEAAALAKIEAYAARFALIFMLVKDIDAAEVDADSIDRGCCLADWFANEAARVYGRLADDDESAELRRLIEYIRARGGSITAREMARSGPRQYRGAVSKAESELEKIAASGLGEWRYPPSGTGVGRPSKTFVLTVISPAVDDETPDSITQSGVSHPYPLEAASDELPPLREEDAISTAGQ